MLKTKGRLHIGTVEISRSTKLEVYVVRHENDMDYIDVRTWFSNIYAGGAWTPTKKGIHVPITAIPAFTERLQAAQSFSPEKLALMLQMNFEEEEKGI